MASYSRVDSFFCSKRYLFSFVLVGVEYNGSPGPCQVMPNMCSPDVGLRGPFVRARILEGSSCKVDNPHSIEILNFGVTSGSTVEVFLNRTSSAFRTIASMGNNLKCKAL